MSERGVESYMVRAQEACTHDLKVPRTVDGGTLCVGCACAAAEQWKKDSQEKKPKGPIVLNPEDRRRCRYCVPGAEGELCVHHQIAEERRAKK